MATNQATNASHMNAFVGLFTMHESLVKRSQYFRKDFWDRHWVNIVSYHN